MAYRSKFGEAIQDLWVEVNKDIVCLVVVIRVVEVVRQKRPCYDQLTLRIAPHIVPDNAFSRTFVRVKDFDFLVKMPIGMVAH
jgi:hypothetical protein